MSPSQTVENYLKAVYQAQIALPDPKALVPMGQLSSALGVVPGTATTMVKALAEAGLVHYEPYSGVHLTKAGEKLAGRVLRRHRLIELFLVQVLGMSWAEVHDEAEQLEHAVSDHLIERIDEMLGRPSVDPHGDPIPGPEGTLAQPDYDTLLSCPLNRPVTISRVIDQNPRFLRFIEESDLKPGQTIQIEERDGAADRVHLRTKDDRRIAIGARAAAKVLVQAAKMLLLLALGGATAAAQTTAPGRPAAPASSRPFEILDNSFLVEEAFNQEAGIFQNIFGLLRIGGGWAAAFTQEWPLRSQTHQLSYSVPFSGSRGGPNGLGDVFIHYRFQAMTEDGRRPAFSPRASLILPTADEDDHLGSGVVGLQVNLPFSRQVNDWYVHWNGGFTWLPGVKTSGDDEDDKVTLASPHLAASVIWRARPMIHLMLESTITWEQSVSGIGMTTRERAFTFSPGVRAGWNVADRQIVLGLAIPATMSGGATNTGVFAYASYELPFRR